MTAAAWKAAETTGAVGHMGYEDAKGFAQLYDLQDDLKRLQAAVLDEATQVMGFFTSGKDPTRDQRQPDLDRLNDRVRSLGMRVTMMDSLAKGVDEACTQIQKRSAAK